MSFDESFHALQENVSKALVDVTRTSGQLAGQDLSFFRTSDPKRARKLEKQSSRLLHIARRLTQRATDGSSASGPLLAGLDDVNDGWGTVIEVVDDLLEKADVSLDEYTGVIKKLSSDQEVQAASASNRGAPATRIVKIPKPQLRFHRLPGNDEVTPFKPLLKQKPHAVVPLEESINSSVSDDGFKQYGHPYAAEINDYQYPSSVYQKSEPILYHAFENTNATFVDTWAGVSTMLSELKMAKEIAIDLEHHDKRSYIGLVSLMQISTRDQDWIIDTLVPWREELQILNEVFADPAIIKVLHGAFMDIMWLQRDLGLYIVGLFDTYHASNALGYPGHSLAYLLKRFAKFDAQKQYQMADWRIRPIPKEMFSYARSDTHFLLYIYDNMRNELLDGMDHSQPGNDLTDKVSAESKKECLQKYEWPFYDAEKGTGSLGWYNMLIRTPALFTRQQFAVFRAVHRWRDELARKEDESLAYVMPKSVLFNIAREVPTNLPALYGCAQPMSEPVRRKTSELLDIIVNANVTGEGGPDMRTFLQEHPLTIEYRAREAERVKSLEESKPPSLAQIIQQERQKVRNGSDPSQKSIRAQKSRFWGATIDGQQDRPSDGSPGICQLAELRLEIPLPPLTAQIFADSPNGAIEAASPAVIPEHQFVKDRVEAPEPGVFVIKELGGRKRKQSINVGPEFPNVSDESGKRKTLDMELAEPSRRKLKQLKRLADAETRSPNGKTERAGNESAEEAPFEYASAPSILNAKPNRERNAAEKLAVFNPYAKSMDAPVGMKRVRKDIEGRSLTFKG